MSAPITETDTWRADDVDMIIDVRSPLEFAEDHIPGAVNLPVLSNEERVIIGTIYKQQSPFLARKKGAVFVARNIAEHVENTLCDLPTSFTPLIHCWRGGQRSRAFARICSEIGWKSYILNGGYKQYRRTVVQELEARPRSLSYIVVAGRTGSAKTDILTSLAEKGAQVLDLEDLAAHRGSLLGGLQDRPQPGQRLFESRLNDALQSFDPAQPVYLESESSRIGQIQLPKDLWKEIIAAPQVVITAPCEARAQYLMTVYRHLTEDTRDLNKLVAGMVYRYGKKQTESWQALIDAGDWHNLAVELLETHYDPAYDRSMKRHQQNVQGEILQADCTQDSVEQTAHEILALFQRKKS
ncbi:MAG: tRNA 2-selenouridine(34) synthase MnmH [Rhodospirillales bacterium]